MTQWAMLAVISIGALLACFGCLEKDSRKEEPREQERTKHS